MSSRKFKPGKVLESLQEVQDCFERLQWIYLRGMPKHPSIVINMSFGTVQRYLKWKMLTAAELNPDWKPRHWNVTSDPRCDFVQFIDGNKISDASAFAQWSQNLHRNQPPSI